MSNAGGNLTAAASSYSTDGLLGKEVLTVNVNQINADLIRQVSSVLSHKDIHDLIQQQPLVTPAFGQARQVPPYSKPSAAPAVLSKNGRKKEENVHTLPRRRKKNESSTESIQNDAELPVHHRKEFPDLVQAKKPVPKPAYSRKLLGDDHATLPRRRKVAPAGNDDRSTESIPNDMQQRNRVSVFEPYPMRDTVQHFCEKHLDKIKAYMESLSVKLPLPVKCTIEERKGRKHAKLHFGCQGRFEEHCLYKTTFYALKTRCPRTWIHLMFLALQVCYF